MWCHTLSLPIKTIKVSNDEMKGEMFYPLLKQYCVDSFPITTYIASSCRAFNAAGKALSNVFYSNTAAIFTSVKCCLFGRTPTVG